MAKLRNLIVLWTTSRCNLECKYCYVGGISIHKDMEFETAKKVLDYFGKEPMKIQFAGGEPMLNFDLIRKVYKYVRERGYDGSFQMQTNGTLVDAGKAKEIKGMNMAIGISLDGVPEVNECLRGKTREVIHGIQMLAQEGIMVNINSVVTAQNVEQIPKLADFSFYLGNIGGIGLDLLREAGRMKESSCQVKKASPSQLESALRSLQQRCDFLYQHSGRKIGVREVEEARTRLKHSLANENYCYASCGRSFVVLPNGDIYPCGSLIDKPNLYMGNLQFEDKIKSISLPKQDRKLCINCKYIAICPGGCPSRLIVNRNISEEVLDCVMKETAFEIAQEELSSNGKEVHI